MEFFCVYVKTRKKIDKYLKVNSIKNKYIIDLRKIQSEEDLDIKKDKTYLKILIFNKIRQAIEKKKTDWGLFGWIFAIIAFFLGGALSG